MKKIIPWILAALILLSGCEYSKQIISTWKECGKIEKIGDNICVYYDTKTKVMYAWNGHSASVLLNADGTPMLWEGAEK